MTSKYTTYSDGELASFLRNSDEQAFTELYNRYWNKLLFIAGVKLRDLAIAEELVQDVFLDLWNRRLEIEFIGQPEAYLAVAMKYKVINAQAKIKRALEHQNQPGKHTAIGDNDVEKWLDFTALKERLEKLVSALPERCRLTYRLNREENMTYKEISSHLNISEKAVEANMSRALRSLKAGLSQFLFFLSFLFIS